MSLEFKFLCGLIALGAIIWSIRTLLSSNDADSAEEEPTVHNLDDTDEIDRDLIDETLRRR